MAILPQVLNTLPAGVVRAGIQRYFFFLFFGQLADWWRLDLTYLAATGNRSGRLLLPPGVCEELFGSDFNCCRDTQSRICFQSLFFFFLFHFFFFCPSPSREMFRGFSLSASSYFHVCYTAEQRTQREM